MNLPRWLVGENVNGKRQFIIHTQEPRFVGEIFDNDAGGSDITDIQFIDQPVIDEQTAGKMAKLMREAGDALIKYDKNLGI
jgi:hypothetical protein